MSVVKFPFRFTVMVCASLLGTPTLANEQSAPIPIVLQKPMQMSTEAQVLGNRIFRSVAKDGSVAFGDAPEPQSQSVTTSVFIAYSGGAAEARAQQQRDYWKKQDQSLRQRMAARDEQLRQEQADAQAAAALERWRQQDNDSRRIVVGARNFPQVPVLGVGAVYTGGLGASAGQGSSFIGSGFARSR